MPHKRIRRKIEWLLFWVLSLNGFAQTTIQTNGLYGLYDRKGKTILPSVYHQITDNFDTGGIILAGKKDSTQTLRYGLFDNTGKNILPLKYLEIKKLGYGFYVAKESDFWSLFRWYQNETLPITDGLVDVTEFSREKAILNRQHRYGMINTDGQIVLPFEYRKIERRFPEYHAFPFAEAQLVNASGKIIRKYFLDSIQPLSPHLFLVTLGGNLGVMKSDGSFVFFNEYDSVTTVREPLLVVWKNGKAGLIDTLHHIVLPCQFNKIAPLPHRLWEVTTASRRHFYDSSGKNRTLHVDNLQSFSEGYVVASQQQKYGLLDSTLQWKILPAYQAIGNVKHGLIPVKQQGLYGVINLDNQFVISPVVDSIAIISQNLMIYHDNGGWGTLQPNGKDYFFSRGSYEILPEGTIRFQNDSGRYGLLDDKGRKILPAQYDFIYPTSQKGLYQTHRHFKRGFVLIHDVEREISKDSAFVNVEVLQPLGEKYIPVKINKRYGFTDHTGRIRIANRYDSIQYFSNNRAAIKLFGKWGFVDDQENIIVQPIYDVVTPFTPYQVSLVQDGSKWGLINTEGKILIAIEYDKIYPNEYGNWVAEKNGKKGLISADGLRSIYPQFDNIIDLGNEFAIVRKKDKYGVYHQEGYAVVFPEWEGIIPNLADKSFFLLKKKNMEIVR